MCGCVHVCVISSVSALTFVLSAALLFALLGGFAKSQCYHLPPLHRLSRCLVLTRYLQFGTPLHCDLGVRIPARSNQCFKSTPMPYCPVNCLCAGTNLLLLRFPRKSLNDLSNTFCLVMRFTTAKIIDFPFRQNITIMRMNLHRWRLHLPMTYVSIPLCSCSFSIYTMSSLFLHSGEF